MNVVDLFAGCGGMSRGFINAGFNICAAFDKWQPAIEVYRKNFKHPIFDADLSDTKVATLISEFEPQIIIGGPPCQDYSSAGKRDEGLGRANLTLDFAEIIGKVKPTYFVMENVERIKNSNTLKEAIKVFKELGYGLSAKVIDASYNGVPQNRKRYFLVGALGETDNFMDFYWSRNLSDTKMTLYDYFGEELGFDFYYRHPRSYNRRGIFSIHEPSPTIRGVNRPIPKTYKKHKGDFDVDLNHIRALTTAERSYIQTFPKDFILCGTKTNLEQMIGNAVPVKLAEYVARNLIEYITYREVLSNNNQELSFIKEDVRKKRCTQTEMNL